MSNSFLSSPSPLELYRKYPACKEWMLAHHIVRQTTLPNGETNVGIVSELCRVRDSKGNETLKPFALGYLKFEDLLRIAKGDWEKAKEQFDLHEGYCFASGTMVLPEKG